jgi:hypothetical protein
MAEDVHRHRPAPADLPDDALGAHRHVVEGDLGELVGAVRLLDRPHLDARRPQVDDEGGEASVPGLRGPGARQQQAPGGVAGPAGPDLPAGHDPAAVDPGGGRPEAGEVGPGVGLGEALGPQLPARQEGGQRLRHERAGAVGDERRGEDLEVLEQRHAGHAVAGQRLPHRGPVEDRPPEPAHVEGPAVA